MQRFKRLSPYLFRQWRWLTGILVLTIIASATAALQPWPMKVLVDYALGGKTAPEALRSMLGAFGLDTTPLTLVVLAAVAAFVLFIVNSVLSIGLSISWSIAGPRGVYDLAADLFAKLQRLSLRFHRSRSVGDSLSRLTDDTSVLWSLADNLLMAPIQQVITLTAMIWIGYTLDPILATLALVVAPLLALSSKFFGRRLKQRAKLGREAQSRLMSHVHQTLGAVPLVQAFGTEPRHTEKFRDLADDAVVLSQRGNLLGSSYGLVNRLITTSGSAAILYVGGVRVLSGAITIGTLLVFMAYVKKMQSASAGLFNIFTRLKTAEASIDRILEILDSDELITERPDAKRLRSNIRGHIRFENVTLGYNAGAPVLDDITMEARSGEVIALVGPTGAGKSSIVSLIPRLMDPWKGRVTLDGIDIRELKLADLRSQISMVLQDPFLMPISVADNIAYGRASANRAEITKAAETAQADEFIRGLPDGYDTVIGEGGTTLSGGERQRLAIARALLADAPVLILDEPTSALDAKTEASVVKAFQNVMKGRTTFIIAHRMSTIRHADRIAVLDHGRLVEMGTHQELLDHKGLYQRYYAHQSGASTEVVA